jgi:hypothetical protein
MRALSATEAITPAIDHVKALLTPFSLKLWLKLGLVAFLAEMSAQVAFPPIGNAHAPAGSAPSIAGGITLIVLVVIGVIGFLIGLALFYLGSRMQLVLMDLVATRTTLVAPAWHRTASRTWRWIGLKIVFFLAIFTILGVILAVPMIYLFRSLPASNAQPPTPASFGIFTLIFVVAFFAIVVILFAIWILRDLVLPFILFEDAPVGVALRSAGSIFSREPGSVLFYLFMKFVLCVAGGIAGELCIMLAVLVIGIPTGGVGVILWFLLHQSGPLGTAIMFVSFALLGIGFLVVFLCAILCIGGPVLIFYQAYALYFMGGRVPHLGNLLEPPPPPMPEPPLFQPTF